MPQQAALACDGADSGFCAEREGIALQPLLVTPARGNPVSVAGYAIQGPVIAKVLAGL